ncbi:MAG: sigma-54-dependent Fis family transcriptional regulator [Nitrospirae bacterium]|nr:sigma-54-dependent Fis family transcriptional regulator [Nitrospirota bacterium]
MKILVVDDESNYRTLIQEALTPQGYRVKVAGSVKEAIGQLEEETFDFTLCDLRMPQEDGMDFLKRVREKGYQTTVIITTAYGNNDLALDAMRNGAYDYLSKPFRPEELVLVLKKAEERERLKRDLPWAKPDPKAKSGFQNIVSKNPEMQKVFDVIKKVADYKSTVLLHGESGTGKELVARAIHYSGERAGRPFVAVNCGAIPETLLESELFGYVKGAFTGAGKSKNGLFEEAHGGTLFLDEVGEIPLYLQVKLLRALQEGEIRRVGDTQPVHVDVRVIAATARVLLEDVSKGRFRQDLFYRLNVIPLTLPPLRERKEDIPMLVNHFLEKYAHLANDKQKQVSSQAMEFLQKYHWPGNVRELENSIERALVLSEQKIVGPQHLPPAIRDYNPDKDITEIRETVSLKIATEILEKDLIAKALKMTRGNKSRASKLLEISVRTLMYKMRQHGIQS